MSSAATPLPRPPKPALVADLLALPEEGRGFELIDGELKEKHPLCAGGGEEQSLSTGHNLAQARAISFTDPFGRRPAGGGRPGGWWLLPEQLVQLGGDLLRPDVAGWRRERLPVFPKVTVLPLRPDWVCEVLSPGHAADDLVRKRRLYHRAEVPHYWIIDPLEQMLTVLRWTRDGYLELLVAESGEVVRAEPFGDLELDIGSLFGDEEA